MANADLERFRLKVREYRLLVNRNQGDLAAYLNLDYNELSNRLNAHKNVRLSHDNVRGIVRALAEWGAITTRTQAEELLDLMLCPHFDTVDLQARPLSKLTVVTNPAVGTTERPPIIPVAPLATSPHLEILQPVDDHQSVRQASDISHNLPKQLSTFIGRHQEVAQIKKLLVLEKVQLVTLVGAGGTGKTRLALHLGAQIVSHFADGVWLVELGSLNNPFLIPQAIAETIGVTEQPGRTILETLVQYLRQRQTLLILDNCEHLVEECSQVVKRLLDRSTQLQILATSREGLGIKGEIRYLVPSLLLPQPKEFISLSKIEEYEALQLFVERARSVSPDFTLEPNDISTLVLICQRLDGIPLALELAAARTKVLSLGQIQTRLDNRFHLLTGGSRADLPHQQTLRGMVEWSYNLLSEAEKRLLARASIFVGSWDLAASERVCGFGAGLEEYEVLDSLTNLANKYLLVVDKMGQEVRYRLLETIRQYGLEKLRESEEETSIWERHFSYYTNLAQELGKKLQFKEQVTSIRRLDKEMDNIRASIEYGLRLEQDEQVLELLKNLELYWEIRGYFSEGRSYLEAVLALPGARGIAHGIALFQIGFMASRQGDLQAAEHYFKECLALGKQFGDKELLARAYTGIGVIPWERGNFAEARKYWEEAVLVSEELIPVFKAVTMQNLGLAILELGGYQEARVLFEKALEIVRGAGNLWSVSLILICQAGLDIVLNDNEHAHFYLVEALATSEEIGFRNGSYQSQAMLGLVLSNEGKFKEAVQALEESLAIYMTGGEKVEAIIMLTGVICLFSNIWLKSSEPGRLAQIAQISGAISAFMILREQVLRQPFRKYYELGLELAQSSLDAMVFKEAFARGQVITLEEAIEYTRQVLAGI